MAFIPVANGVELVFNFDSDDLATAKLVFGVQLTLPAALDTLFAIISTAATSIGMASTKPWSTHWVLHSMTANALDSATAPTVTAGDSPMPIAGSGSGACAPDNCCVVATMQSGLRGRSYRGRNYWPGIPSAELATDSALLAASVAQWETFIDDSLITPMAAAEFPLCVISRHHDGAPRSEGIMTNIIGCRVETKLGTQRRRLTGSFGGI